MSSPHMVTSTQITSKAFRPSLAKVIQDMSFHLLDLPHELLLHVLDFAVVHSTKNDPIDIIAALPRCYDRSRTIVQPADPIQSQRLLQPAVTRTCRLLRIEGLKKFYSDNIFFISDYAFYQEPMLHLISRCMRWMPRKPPILYQAAWAYDLQTSQMCPMTIQKPPTSAWSSEFAYSFRDTASGHSDSSLATFGASICAHYVQSGGNDRIVHREVRGQLCIMLKLRRGQKEHKTDGWIDMSHLEKLGHEEGSRDWWTIEK